MRPRKIFAISRDGYTLTYSVADQLIADQDRSVFDISAECQAQAGVLSSGYLNSIPDFLDTLGRALKRYVGNAIKERRIELPPRARNSPAYGQLLPPYNGGTNSIADDFRYSRLWWREVSDLAEVV